MHRDPGSKVVGVFAAILANLVVLACASRPGPPSPRAVPTTAAGERVFTAVLYPYIPDTGNDRFATLVATLESWFERENPGIDLQLTIDPDMNLYDLDTLGTLLGTGEGSVDMVEDDTLLLGTLVSNNLVQPLPFEIEDWGIFKTALEAARVSSTTYGVPTYLCGNYIYAWDAGITSVDTGQGLIEFLDRDLAPGETALVGDFQGSWTLPALYVDAWADTHGNDPVHLPVSYDLPLDTTTMSVFQPVADLCGDSGGPCLDGAYKDNTVAETLFAQNRARGFVGFSERLFYILEARGGDLTLPSVISAPLGVDSEPLMFVDALVLNRACTGQCADDAESFSRFMSTLRVRNLIAFSQDAPAGTFPRYLLQALAGFYSSSPARDNPIFRQLAPFVRISQPIPNEGFPEARRALDSALEEELKGSRLEDVAASLPPR